jgi:hypothetical protein
MKVGKQMHFKKMIRHKLDYLFFQLDRLFNYSFEKHKFYKKHGYRLNLAQPQSYSEKIIWKKINDFNPLLPVTADKYLVRLYVEAVLGSEKTQEILVPLLFCSDDPEKIPFEKLPAEYIIKANHASGSTIIVRNNYSPEHIKEMCRRFLAYPYGLAKHERAYFQVKRKIVIEELLKDERDSIPKDYKYYIFNGKCHLIQVIDNRFGEGGPIISFYNPAWEKLPVNLYNENTSYFRKPSNHDKMVNLAAALGRYFDFVRVDFYSINNKIYIGELTHYPKSGRRKFNPVEFDFELGKHWILEPNYWEKEKEKIAEIINKVNSLAQESVME